jgi:hypothetical protein
MHAPLVQVILGYLANFLLILLCGLAFRRRLYRRLPIFTVFLTLQTLLSILEDVAYHVFGFTSHLYFYIYFSSDAVLFVAEAACIFELAYAIGRPYAGLRYTVPKVLSYLMAALLLFSVVDVVSHRERFGITVYLLERDFQLAAGVVLLSLCIIAAYYSVFPVFFERYALWGLLVNLLIPGINFALSYWLRYTNVILGLVEILAFHGALLFWLFGLIHFPPLPIRETAKDFEGQQKEPERDEVGVGPMRKSWANLIAPIKRRKSGLLPHAEVRQLSPPRSE